MIAYRDVCFGLSCVLLAAASALAQAPAPEKEPEEKQPQVVELVEGKLLLPVPGAWERIEPRNRIIAHEFSAPAEEKDGEPGRLTIMSAGGGVEANVARWAGQFKTAEGKPLADEDKQIEEKQVAALTVHLVDLAGTFADQPRGPFGPSVDRPDYRMLAAIIPTEKHGTWFLKFYGPKALVDAEAERFAAMIDGLEWRE